MIPPKAEAPLQGVDETFEPSSTPLYDSPATRVRLLTSTLICLGTAALAIPWDFILSLKIRYGLVPGDVKKLINLSEVAAHFLTLSFIFLLLLHCDLKNRRKIWLSILFVGLAGLISNASKILIPRVRPNALDHLTPEDYPQNWWELWGTPFSGSWFEEAIRSFPSGHSATATAVAIALTYIYPRGKWFFVFLASLACFQRLQSGAHYISDVMVGVALSLALAYLFLPIFERTNAQQIRNTKD